MAEGVRALVAKTPKPTLGIDAQVNDLADLEQRIAGFPPITINATSSKTAAPAHAHRRHRRVRTSAGPTSRANQRSTRGRRQQRGSAGQQATEHGGQSTRVGQQDRTKYVAPKRRLVKPRIGQHRLAQAAVQVNHELPGLKPERCMDHQSEST